MNEKKQAPFFIQVANNQVQIPAPDQALEEALVMAGTYVNFEDVRADLWGILDDIARNGEIKDSKMEVEDFIETRENMSDGYKIEKGKLQKHTEPYNNAYQLWYVQLTVGLIEFLSGEDLKKLKRCLHCTEFFVASDRRSNRKYCDTCSPKNKMTAAERNEYQKNYRKLVKKHKKIKREKDIKALMNGNHLTRIEAEEYLKE